MSLALLPDDRVIDRDVNPLLEHLGIKLASWTVGRAEFTLDIQPWHMNRSGNVQGGVIATLLDVACGYAGLRDDDGAIGNSVTIGLSTNFLDRAPRQGKLVATGNVVRAGRSLYFANGEVRDSAGKLVAAAQGSFKRMR